MKNLVSFSLSVLLAFIGYCQSNPYPNSIIVRLNHKLLNFEAIDNTELIGGRIEDFLNESGKKKLASLQPTIFSGLYFRKSFRDLQTSDSVSISRTGQKVYIPPFWATFNVSAVNGEDVTKLISQLKNCYPLVIYAHPNYPLTFDDFPNDTLFDIQKSLYSGVYPNAHIRVDSAWNIETGERYIKVGVFDTGIDTTNSDLRPSVLGGWAYNELDGESFWGKDITGVHGHGTLVAGIIGAKRNNTNGVAGIAGGNGDDTSGVSLLDFRLAKSWDAETASRAVINAARSVGTYYDWSQSTPPPINDDFFWNASPGYGINIGNHSYGFRLSDNRDDTLAPGLNTNIILKDQNDSLPIVDVYDYIADCLLCRESFLFSLQNGVVNVVSRGNGVLGSAEGYYGTGNRFPANYHDSWVVSVGGSGTNGQWFDGSNGYPTESIFYTQIGRQIDLIAPATQSLVYSTASVFALDTVSKYAAFSGSSAAAPHVSGVAALLLSKYNKNCYSNLNLDPADIEYILQKSAVDVSSSGYDVYSGWGRLDAHKALKMIDFPEYQIIHPITTPTINLVNQDTITFFLNKPLNQPSLGPISTSFPLQLENYYLVERLEYNLTYDFSSYIQPSTELLDTWIRHSQTNSLAKINDTIGEWVTEPAGNVYYVYDDTIDIEPMSEIVSVNPTGSIVLKGYYYHFIGRYIFADDYYSPTTPVDYWYPINPNLIDPKMPFSIYIRDSLAALYDFPCDSLNAMYDSLANVIDQPNPQFDFTVFPNPSEENTLYIELNDGNFKAKEIVIYDISGGIVANQLISDNKKMRQLEVGSLKSGIYFVNLRTSDNRILTKKWIKL